MFSGFMERQDMLQLVQPIAPTPTSSTGLPISDQYLQIVDKVGMIADIADSCETTPIKALIQVKELAFSLEDFEP